MVTVYADVLISVNIIITYIFIVCVRVMLGVPTGKWFVALGSVLGGLSSIVIFFEDGGLLFAVAYRIAVGAIITAVTFLPKGIRGFLRIYVAFIGISFLFGGAIYCIESAVNPHNLIFVNGAVYFDMSVTYLVGMVVAVYGIFTLFQWFLSKQGEGKNRIEVIINFRGTQVSVSGYVDTGNSMRDGLSGNPVFVANLSAISPFFSYEELRFLRSDFAEAPPCSLERYYRLLPCSTITGKCLLPAFVPDGVTLHSGKRRLEIDRVTIAIAPHNITDNGCDMLLNRSVYDMDWKELKNENKIYR